MSSASELLYASLPATIASRRTPRRLATIASAAASWPLATSTRASCAPSPGSTPRPVAGEVVVGRRSADGRERPAARLVQDWQLELRTP